MVINAIEYTTTGAKRFNLNSYGAVEQFLKTVLVAGYDYVNVNARNGQAITINSGFNARFNVVFEITDGEKTITSEINQVDKNNGLIVKDISLLGDNIKIRPFIKTTWGYDEENKVFTKDDFKIQINTGDIVLTNLGQSNAIAFYFIENSFVDNIFHFNNGGVLALFKTYNGQYGNAFYLDELNNNIIFNNPSITNNKPIFSDEVLVLKSTVAEKTLYIPLKTGGNEFTLFNACASGSPIQTLCGGVGNLPNGIKSVSGYFDFIESEKFNIFKCNMFRNEVFFLKRDLNNEYS